MRKAWRVLAWLTGTYLGTTTISCSAIAVAALPGLGLGKTAALLEILNIIFVGPSSAWLLHRAESYTRVRQFALNTMSVLVTIVFGISVIAQFFFVLLYPPPNMHALAFGVSTRLAVFLLLELVGKLRGDRYVGWPDP